MPPPLECGAGPARDWAGGGKPGRHGLPSVYSLPGNGASREGTGWSGLQGARRPPARIGRALATPCALIRPCGLRPALTTPLQPNSSSANPAWAGQEVPGQSRRLPLGASRARSPGIPRPRIPRVWTDRSLPQSPLPRTCGAQPFPTTQSRERGGGVNPSQMLVPIPLAPPSQGHPCLYTKNLAPSRLCFRCECVCVSAIGAKMVPHHILPTLPRPTTLPDRKEPRNFLPRSLPWNQLWSGAAWTRRTFCKIYILPWPPSALIQALA